MTPRTMVPARRTRKTLSKRRREGDAAVIVAGRADQTTQIQEEWRGTRTTRRRS